MGSGLVFCTDAQPFSDGSTASDRTGRVCNSQDLPPATLRQIDQRVVGLAVVRLAAGEVEGEQPAAGVTDQVNITGEPTPRAAKSLFLSPPLAPAPVRLTAD